MTVSFFIEGTPRPGGSKTAMPIYGADGHALTTLTAKNKHKPILVYVDQGKRGKAKLDWRAAAAWTAKAYMHERCLAPLGGPLELAALFIMPRPKAAAGRMWHTEPPDTTKLVRSTEDALTGIVWIDDKLIVIQHAEKRYASDGEAAGAWITVKQL